MTTSVSLHCVGPLQPGRVRGERLTDEAPGGGVLQVVVLGEQRHDLGEDGLAHQLSLLVFGHDSRPHLDLLPHLEDTQRRSVYDFMLHQM